jgi:1,4-dihydroxy-2-naphthoate octaprenyltransferase
MLGILAILAAIRYTIGATAYGYRGLGDVFVFIFWDSQYYGREFLYSKQIDIELFCRRFRTFKCWRFEFK